MSSKKKSTRQFVGKKKIKEEKRKGEEGILTKCHATCLSSKKALPKSPLLIWSLNQNMSLLI